MKARTTARDGGNGNARGNCQSKIRYERDDHISRTRRLERLDRTAIARRVVGLTLKHSGASARWHQRSLTRGSVHGVGAGACHHRGGDSPRRHPRSTGELVRVIERRRAAGGSSFRPFDDDFPSRIEPMYRAQAQVSAPLHSILLPTLFAPDRLDDGSEQSEREPFGSTVKVLPTKPPTLALPPPATMRS